MDAIGVVEANYGPFLICYRLTGATLESEDLDAAGGTSEGQQL